MLLLLCLFLWTPYSIAEENPWLPGYGEKPQEEKKELPKLEEFKNLKKLKEKPRPDESRFEDREIDPTHWFSEELRKSFDQWHEKSQIEFAKGLALLNQNQLNDAYTYFEKALESDSRNFLALEYLAHIEELRKELYKAIAWFVRAKHHALKNRWGYINFHIGRLYFELKNLPRARTYLLLAIDQKAFPVQSNYLMGLAYYLENQFFEAGKYLYRAKRALNRLIPRPSVEKVDRELHQAIHFYLADCYARLDHVRYTAANLKEAEHGESTAFRAEGWLLHSQINKSISKFTLANFIQYDSNVILLATDSSLPSSFSSQSSLANVFVANGSWNKSIAPRWSYGTEGSLYWNYHLNKTVHAYDLLNGNVSLLGSLWNRKDWSLNGKYTLNQTHADRKEFSRFQTLHGPFLSFDYFPTERWIWQIATELKFINFEKDAAAQESRRNGFTLLGSLSLAFHTPLSRWAYKLGYQYEQYFADGVNFSSTTNKLLLELSFRTWKATYFLTSFHYSLVTYSAHQTGRNDNISHARLSINHRFNKHWLWATDGNYIIDSSTLTGWSYNRLVVTSGLGYIF